MEVNDVFTMFGYYYGGYQMTNLVGKGFFSTPTTPRIQSRVGNYELGFRYAINHQWNVAAYSILTISGNNPNWAAIKPPISSSGLTTNSLLYGIRLGYNF